MTEKTMALITAAGYGRRMGDIDVPKVMLLDREGRPFIEDALTFLDYKSDALDFAVSSRDEKFFKPLNEYLHNHPHSHKFSVLYQTIKPKEFHVMAILLEYLRHTSFFKTVSQYDNIIVLPADHKLTSKDLNLEDLMQGHKEKGALVTLVYSEGWNSPTAHKEVLSLDDNGRIKYLMRVDHPTYQEDEGYIRVTSTGVWVLKRSILNNPTRLAIAFLGFKLGYGKAACFAAAFPYFIASGWDGVRDTPQDLLREKYTKS